MNNSTRKRLTEYMKVKLYDSDGYVLQNDKQVVKFVLYSDYAALEEKVRELEAYKADIENATKGAMDETCGYEKHCTCVPLLRQRVKQLEAELSNRNRSLDEALNSGDGTYKP